MERQITAPYAVARNALVLIRQHGANAPIYASMRHDELFGTGDIEGTAVWKRVLAAIDTALAEKRPDGTLLQ